MKYGQKHDIKLLKTHTVYPFHAFILTMSSPLFCFFKGFFRKRKTSNLEAYVNWFNRLSYLVATEICMVRSSYG